MENDLKMSVINLQTSLKLLRRKNEIIKYENIKISFSISMANEL